MVMKDGHVNEVSKSEGFELMSSVSRYGARPLERIAAARVLHERGSD